MSYDTKKKFLELTENSKYKRVSESHPLEIYLGLDSNGNKVLRLNEKFEIQSVKSSAKIKVSQYKDSAYNSILFTNTGDDEIFYQFCNDLINTANICNPQTGYQFLLNRYSKWRKMFASNKETLSIAEIMGLIGELLFLKEFTFIKHGIHEGILGWSGTEPTHKDFSYDEEWFEIKSIDAQKSVVKISSLEQLDSTVEGTLVVIRLEKMSASFEGLSLNKLIAQIKDQIFDEDTLDIFENKLLQAGYTYLSAYDDIVFCYINKEAYRVTSNFPRLKRKDLPREIASVKYELLLNAIEEFKVKL